jgi:hypothetical protein
MASILDRYGIKEVADVTFYEIGDNGQPTVPVLYLDTLKVSTIEQTAETSEARGGKGNAALIAWDYGKEINVTIEDALFSAKSLAIMFGNGTVTQDLSGNGRIQKTEQFVATETVTVPDLQVTAEGGGKVWVSKAGWSHEFATHDGRSYTKLSPKFYTADGKEVVNVTGSSVNNQLVEGEKYFCSYYLSYAGMTVDVSADSFPGTYYVTGDTFARSDTTGKDEFFQFVLPKAKVQSENTLTLEAEGDPSVFNMSLKVLRPADGIMMKLIKYDLANPTSGASMEVGSMAL